MAHQIDLINVAHLDILYPIFGVLQDSRNHPLSEQILHLFVELLCQFIRRLQNLAYPITEFNDRGYIHGLRMVHELYEHSSQQG